ncbi:hypothetical protein ACMSI6_03750 [Pseudomonas antarctica]|uniref:hypothetical protein n=1 Tax=Pseudomonas antarctica TaxID=219572 RepID=UPI0039C12612
MEHTLQVLYPWLPVVLTTGYNDEYAGIAQQQAQRFVLLQKSCSTEMLAVRLHKVVNSRLNLKTKGSAVRPRSFAKIGASLE